MTKLNATNNDTNTRNGGARVRNAIANVASRDVATIALKTLHNDIIRDDATFTRTTKQMRVALRANFAHIHDKNNAWTFTQSQYDIVRSHFDAKYRARIERASKRNAKSNDAKPARKRNTKSRDVVANETPVVIDANVNEIA